MTDRVLWPRSLNTSYYSPRALSPLFSQSSEKITSKITKPRITKNHLAPQKPRPKTKSASNLQSTLPRTPYFSPMTHSYPLHNAQNRLPPSILAQDVIGPRHIFDLFFSDDILQLMVQNTNLYAAEKRNKDPEKELVQGRAWKPVSVGELRCWFGIVIYMGLIKEPAISDYWRGEHDILWPRHDFCDYMSQTRFEEIKRYFHIAEIDAPKFTPSGSRLWHGKVDPLLDHLRLTSQAYRLPQSNVTIDEAMMRFLGQSIDICKMPGKPIEIGYKFHCLADCGYVWDFWPHSGTKDGYNPLPPNATQPVTGGLTPTGAMCLHLAKRLPYRTMAFNIYMDNYYTTLDLLSNFRDIGIGGCGTTRKDRTGSPEELKCNRHAFHNGNRT